MKPLSVKGRLMLLWVYLTAISLNYVAAEVRHCHLPGGIYQAGHQDGGILFKRRASVSYSNIHTLFVSFSSFLFPHRQRCSPIKVLVYNPPPAFPLTAPSAHLRHTFLSVFKHCSNENESTSEYVTECVCVCQSQPTCLIAETRWDSKAQRQPAWTHSANWRSQWGQSGPTVTRVNTKRWMEVKKVHK